MSETIRIGVFPLEKDAQTCFERPDCKHPGAEVEILKMVFRLIRVNYTILDVWKEFGEQYDFGAQQPNGSWSGMIGLLHQGCYISGCLLFNATGTSFFGNLLHWEKHEFGLQSYVSKMTIS